MATNNYVNPTALMPQTGFQPGGFLGGHMLANQENLFNQQMKQQQLMQNLDMLKQQMEMDTYQQDAPLRAANRGLGIASATAQTPIQGDLASGLAADARVKAGTVDSRISGAKFDVNKKKHDFITDQVASQLGPLFDAKLPPQEIMMKWQNEIAPMLEQATQEPMPVQLKQMDPTRLQQFYSAAVQSIKHRQEMEKQSAHDAASYKQATDVATIGANSRRDVARTKGDQTTSAEMKQKEIQDLTMSYVDSMMTRGGKASYNEQEFNTMKNQAYQRAVETILGGNPMGRSEGAIQTGSAKALDAITQFEMVQAAPDPGPNKRQPNQVYKSVTGKYFKVDNEGRPFEVRLQGQQ